MNEPLSATCVPTRKTDPSAGARILAVGATFVTWIVFVSSTKPPSLSITRARTAMSPGPSTAGQVFDAVVEAEAYVTPASEDPSQTIA